jgi:hypothetical protein
MSEDNVLLGIDTSYDDVSVAEARQLFGAGIQVALQCLWTGVEQPPHRVSNLRNYHRAGLIVGAYASLPDNAAYGSRHMDSARGGVPDDLWAALVRCAVDVERPGITRMAVRDATSRVVELGKPRTIYTNFDTWVNKLGNPTTFTDCELWDASWQKGNSPVFDGSRDFDARPYGNWRPEQVIAQQYTGGVNVEGVYVDRNVLFTTREQLLGQPAAGVANAIIALRDLRIAILENGIDALRRGDGAALGRVAAFMGGSL